MQRLEQMSRGEICTHVARMATLLGQVAHKRDNPDASLIESRAWAIQNLHFFLEEATELYAVALAAHDYNPFSGSSISG
jgi:hypothetical protein